MKEELLALSKRAMTLIPHYVVQGDAPAIARLTTAAKEIKILHQLLAQLEEGMQRNEQVLDHYSRNITPVSASAPNKRNKIAAAAQQAPAKQKLRIEIDWGRAGKGEGREVIYEHTS